MIKLELTPKPDALTDELERELTAKYKADGSDVWNAKFIREAVLRFSYGKCCYSECKLQEESKYMEVDHFYPKKYFPDKVVEWGNLLPSSKKCNTTKGEHDPKIEPIINPCIEHPKKHLYIINYRFYPRTDTGKRTIDVVALNNRPHFLNKRSKIGHEVSEIINDIYDEIKEEGELILRTASRNRRIIRKFKNLLEEASRENEYSATISTVILTDEYYPLIEHFFVDNNLWDQELIDLKEELLFCCLIK